MIRIPWCSSASEKVHMIPVLMIHSVNLHNIRQLTDQLVVVTRLAEIVSPLQMGREYAP